MNNPARSWLQQSYEVQLLQRLAPQAEVQVGDACHPQFADASADAVVDFGLDHHVPAWRHAVAEAARVLRPGGQFVFEEVTRHALKRWSYCTFLDPEQDRFSAEEFATELGRHGFTLRRPAVTRFFDDLAIRVAVKSATMSRGSR